MKIYVVEKVYDYKVQLGFTLDKNRAEFECRERNKRLEPYDDEYFVTEYEIDKPSDFCEFD